MANGVGRIQHSAGSPFERSHAAEIRAAEEFAPARPAADAMRDELAEVERMQAELAELRERTLEVAAAEERVGEAAEPAPAAEEERAQARRARAAEAIVVELSGRLSASEHRVADADAERERLEAMVGERDGALRAALRRAHSEEEQRLELEQRVGEAEAHSREAQERAGVLDHRRAELEQACETLQAATSAAGEQVAGIEVELGEARVATGRAAQRAKVAEDLAREHAGTSERLTHLRVEAEQRAGRAQDENERLREENAGLGGEKVTLHEELAAERRQAAVLTDQRDQARKAAETAARQTTALADERDRAREATADGARQIAAIAEERDQARDAAEIAARQAATLAVERDRAGQALEAAAHRSETLASERDQAREAANAARRDADARHARAAEAVDALSGAVARVTRAERSLEAERQARADDAESLRCEQQARAEAREVLRGERQVIHERLAVAAARADRDARLIAELSAALEQMETRLVSMSGRVDAEVDELRRRLEGARPARSATSEDSSTSATRAADEPARSRPIPVRRPGPRPARDGGWVGGALRSLASADPAVGGHVLLHLLPLQGRAASDFVPLDVTVPGVGRFSTGPGNGPPEHLEVTLTTVGRIAASSVRTVGRSPIYRDAGGRVPRRLVRQLQLLAGAPLCLADVREAGAAPEPVLVFALLARGLDPGWTVGHRATIGFDFSDEAAGGRSHVLQFNDGAPLSATTRPPIDPPATIVRCSTAALLAILLGEDPQDARMIGDPLPVSLLQGWVERLEAGRG